MLSVGQRVGLAALRYYTAKKIPARNIPISSSLNSSFKYNNIRLLSLASGPLRQSESESLAEFGTVIADPTASTISEASAAAAAAAASEPSFHSLGLAHSWPSGWLQGLMEQIHLTFDIPWWATIVTTTICMRVLVFPLIVKTQRNMGNLTAHMPEMEKLKERIEFAEDDKEKAKAIREYQMYIKKNNANPMNSLLPIIGNGVVFASMFFALRGMTNVPVESMKEGGALWFSNLVVADPFFILPLLTCTSIYTQLKIGADGMSTDTMPPVLQKLIYIFPVISLPIMIQFPAALNVYWLSTNLISVMQALLLKHPEVRKKLNLPDRALIAKRAQARQQLTLSDFIKEQQLIAKEVERRQQQNISYNLNALRKEIRDNIRKEKSISKERQSRSN